MAPSIRVTSSTVLAIGPGTDRVYQAAVSEWLGTRPGVGRRPTTLQKDAGLRREPPMSVPSASGTMPVASAAAAPPLLPPADLDRSYGFLVAPNTSLTVWEPVPNSGVFVLPIVIAPAARSRWTTTSSRSGTLSAKSGEPYVVRMPAVSVRSLCATGTPCSGPAGPSRRSVASATSAARSAWSATRVTTALTCGLTWSMRSRWARTTSTALTCLVLISWASSVAVR